MKKKPDKSINARSTCAKQMPSVLSEQQTEDINWMWTSQAALSSSNDDQLEAQTLERLRDDPRMRKAYTLWADLYDPIEPAESRPKRSDVERRGPRLLPTLICNAFRKARAQKKTRDQLRRERLAASNAARGLVKVVRDHGLERSIARYRPDDESIAAWIWPEVKQLVSEQNKTDDADKWKAFLRMYRQAEKQFTSSRGGWWNEFSHLVTLFADDLEAEARDLGKSVKKQQRRATAERIAFIRHLDSSICALIGAQRSDFRERQRRDPRDELMAIVTEVAYAGRCSVKDVQNALRGTRRKSINPDGRAAADVFQESFSLAVQPDFSRP